MQHAVIDRSTAKRSRSSARRGLFVLLSTIIVTLGAIAVPSASAAGASPAKKPPTFDAVTAFPGPGLGEITVSWQHSAKNTTGYRVETSLTPFSATSATLPRKGRQYRKFRLAPEATSLRLTAAEVAKAGAKVGSGAHLLIRVSALNTKGVGSAIRRYPLIAAMPKAPGSPAGTDLRAASFNVRTAKALGDRRVWLKRRADVAAAIAGHKPTVVMLQELGPGRSDGRAGALAGTMRQTESLVQSLKTIRASRYKLVRTTPYVKSGSKTGTQGARILYDSAKLSLLSVCSETTRGAAYSNSCTIKLPLLAGDGESSRRRAAYAKFRNKSDGQMFYVVSAHLDARHDKLDVAREQVFTELRAAQVRTIMTTIDGLNTGRLPVVFGGDINSWQSLKVGNLPHDALVARGCYDTADAATKVNLQYSTLNNFSMTQESARRGFAPRLDIICVTGAKGADRFVNVTHATDSTRPSDHNMIYADTAI